MEPRCFTLNFDYRCPFARNANELVVAGLASGAPWDVTFVPFCLGQTKVEPGGTSVWDDPATDSGLAALEAGAAVTSPSASSMHTWRCSRSAMTMAATCATRRRWPAP
ncbi:MAG: hypothetical protein ACR2K0_03765 [Acidimicrobiales bacterium]